MNVPNGRPSCSFTRTLVPSTDGALPVSTRLPSGSSTRTESAETATFSEKVSVTCSGARLTTAPCFGSLPVSAACADAGPAPASNSPAMVSSSSTSTRAIRGPAVVAVRGAVVGVTVVPP